jgi:hypothetical protein
VQDWVIDMESYVRGGADGIKLSQQCETDRHSPILRIIPTHSVAREISEVLTSRGCTTFMAHMSATTPCLTLMPAEATPAAWRLRNSVTIWIGLMPAFSASVYGMISRAYLYGGKE